MDKITFKISLLDSFGYPIERYLLNMEGPITEESVMKEISRVIPEITSLMNKVKKEELEG
jgi:hypothetical protein